MKSIRHVVGPPGTGKTSRLMEVLGELLPRHGPLLVGVTTFTRAGVHEVQRRIGEALGLDLRSWRGGKVGTVHSLCFHLLGRPKLVNRRAWQQFCATYQIATEDPGQDDLYEPWEPAGRMEGDIFRAWYDWARGGLMDLSRAARLYDPGYGVQVPPPERLLALASLYERFKQENGLLDFCDLLLTVLERRLRLGVRCLLVDEAQDLSPLQRQVVLMWAEEAEEVWWFYDPDQTIYSWQHADPGWLIEMPGEREFLSQSHRVPRQVAALAQRYIALNRSRYDHTFLPRDAEGEVSWWHLYQLERELASNGHGTWGLLARNRYLLPEYERRLQELGLPYVHLRGHSPIPCPPAVTAALRLAMGEAVSLEEVRAMAERMPARPNWRNRAELVRQAKAHPTARVRLRDLPSLGAKPDLVEALSQGPAGALARLSHLPPERRRYYLRVLEHGGLTALAGGARITISTIHAVKGREFDHVAVLPDWAARTRDGYWEDPEPERRVWYVAMTRARERLILLEPITRDYNRELL